MRKLIQKLKHDCRGAVTVFVALMLLPAVLVSGTGVDIARIYAARSAIQDANQLAAGSALASYDALLQDLYGLYGIMQTDEELASMMERYIRLTVFGEDWQDRSMGTFAHFYGDRSSLSVTAASAPDKNLENPEVLRRQIEEYAKFRAPAIIVKEILDRLETFQKIQEDASVIQDKMAIDDKIEEIDKIYKKIYECINRVNQAGGTENNAIQSVNSYIDRIRSTIDDLYETRTDDYTPAAKAEDDELMDDYAEKYQGIFDNLHNLISGGKIRESYCPGGWNDGDYEPGYFMGGYSTEGLESTSQESADALKKHIKDLQELLDLAEDADRKKEELSRMVNDLEERLNSGQCSDELRKGMAEKKNEDGQTCLDTYRSLLKYDITAMAQAMKEVDETQIKETVTLLTDRLGYGDYDKHGTQGFFSLTALKDLNENQDGYQVTLIIENESRYRNDQTQQEDKLGYLDGIAPREYEVPGSFEQFQSDAFRETHNPEFYEMLKKMYGAKSGDAKKGKILKSLEKVAKNIQEQFTGFLEFEPLGAWTYANGGGAGGSESTAFGRDGDWGSPNGAKDQAKNALNDDLLGRIAGAGNAAANKILLLTYDSEMFSCYATNAGYSGTEQEAKDEPTEKSMAGIPLGIKVNYYFQSELEYLYNGDLNNAKANLAAVTGMILLVRFVLDYIASFSIKSVNNTVRAVKEALTVLGPGAIVVGELVRLVMALGEGVSDVSRLKNGCTVALYKNDDLWRFSLEGILNQITDGVGDAVSCDSLFNSGSTGGSEKDSDDSGFTYKDYMRLFLLLVDGDVLAQRTAKLIELNVTNYRDGIGNSADRSAREQAMSAAKPFDMSKAVTDLSVTTTVTMKMLFLSSPAAQKGYVNGVIPPGSKELTVTDYRGY